MVSPCFSAEQAPTATASWPWQRCVDARTRLRLKRFITSFSNSRISIMRRSMPSRDSRSRSHHCSLLTLVPPTSEHLVWHVATVDANRLGNHVACVLPRHELDGLRHLGGGRMPADRRHALTLAPDAAV